MILVGAGFCLSALKDNHHAIFFAPLSFLRRYLFCAAIFFAPLSCGRTVLSNPDPKFCLCKQICFGEGL